VVGERIKTGVWMDDLEREESWAGDGGEAASLYPESGWLIEYFGWFLSSSILS
jgi:hypothetical protein